MLTVYRDSVPVHQAEVGTNRLNGIKGIAVASEVFMMAFNILVQLVISLSLLKTRRQSDRKRF